jgi:hypothetical protein
MNYKVGEVHIQTYSRCYYCHGGSSGGGKDPKKGSHKRAHRDGMIILFENTCTKYPVHNFPLDPAALFRFEHGFSLEELDGTAVELLRVL